MWEWPQQEALDVRRGTNSRPFRAASTRAWRRRASCRSSGPRWATLEGKLDSLKAILPEEKDVADLLRRIQTLAAQSNLTIRHFRPRAITAKELHAEWPIEIEVEGAYHSVGLFLDRVAKLPRIINVGSIEMTGAPPRPGSAATVKVTCTAMTFVLNDQPTGAPAPGVPAKKTE